MPFGLTTLNGVNELTLSSDGFLFGYIGRAVNTQLVQPDTSGIVQAQGYSVYTIDWPGNIIIALPVKTSGSTDLSGVTRAGNTWTIRVYHSAGSINSSGFDVQAVTQVYVWGSPTSVAGYGLAIYNESGAVAGDLSRQPLTFQERVTIAAGAISRPMTGYSVPAIVGSPARSLVTTSGSGSSFVNRFYDSGWLWDSGGTTLARVVRQRLRVQDDGPAATDIFIGQTNAILLEAAGLP